MKFTGDGGKFSFAPPMPVIVSIEIADTGIGIAPELLPKVFNAFEQGDLKTTRRFGGLGLGLDIYEDDRRRAGLHRPRRQGPRMNAAFTIDINGLDAEDGRRTENCRPTRPRPGMPRASCRRSSRHRSRSAQPRLGPRRQGRRRWPAWPSSLSVEEFDILHPATWACPTT